MNQVSKIILALLLIVGFSIGCKSTKTVTETPVATATTPQPKVEPSTEVSSQSELSKPIPFDPNTKVGKLDNGLTYYIRKNSEPQNRAELRLALNAGSLLETDAQQGLAHFVEHMAFNGTKNFPKNDLINYLESIGTRFGAHLNAYTSFDETVYMLRVPTDSAEIFETGFQILEEWAHLVSFDGEEIDKERGVVIEEWRTRLGAGQRMQQKTLPKLFYKSKYPDRIPIGKVDILESFPHDELRQYYKDWYRPDLMAVVAVGDFEIDEVEKIIQEKFGRIPKAENPKSRPDFEIPNHQETLIAIASDEEASGNRIGITYKHDPQPMKTLADYRKKIIDQLCTYMLYGRLYELVQKENPPFINSSAGYGRFMRTKDGFSASATVPPGGYLRGLEAVLTETERAVRHGFTVSELEREKKSIITGLESQYKERDKTNSARLVNQYVQHYLSGSPVPGIENSLKLYQALLPSISLGEVNARMKEYMSLENRVITATGSSKDGATMPTEEEILAVLEKVTKLDIAPYQDDVSDAPLMAQTPQAGSVSSQNYIEELNTTEIMLSNGVKVFLKPTDFKNDQIIMQGYSPGGHSLYPDERYMSASFASTFINRSGLGEFNNIQLEKYLADKEARVGPSISELSESISGSCSPEDLELFLQMTHLYFTQPRMDEVVVNAYLSRLKNVLVNYLEQPESYFQNELNKILTQNHPRREYLPTTERLDQIDIEDAFNIYKERFEDASDFTFFFVGNFETENLIPLLAQYLGSLPSTNSQETWKDVGVDYPKGQINKDVYKGKEPKSNVVLEFNGDFEWSQEERYKLSSMMQVLNIMLRESMREDKGGVYGVNAGASSSKNPKEEYSVRISFTCSPENVDDLISTALKDMKDLQDNGPSEENMVKIKEIQRKDQEENLRKNGYWMTYLFQSHLYDLDLMRFQKYADRTNTLSAEDIQEAAKKYLKTDNFVKAVLYPEDKSR